MTCGRENIGRFKIAADFDYIDNVAEICKKLGFIHFNCYHDRSDTSSSKVFEFTGISPLFEEIDAIIGEISQSDIPEYVVIRKGDGFSFRKKSVLD